MKFCYFLIFSFFLLSTESLENVAGSEEPAPIESPNNSPLPKITCDCIQTCEKLSIMGNLYIRLIYQENRVEHAKDLIREMEGWVTTWEDNSEPDTPNKKTTPTSVSEAEPTSVSEAEPTSVSEAEPTPVIVPDNTSGSLSESVPTNETTATNATTPSADTALTATSKPPNSPPQNSSPIVTTTERTGQTVKTEDNKHFYQSTFFFALVFLSIIILISIYFCYVSRRKIKVYLNKNLGVGRSNKAYGRVPNLEEAMPSFADVKS